MYVVNVLAVFDEMCIRDRYYAPLMCCLFLGLREGEALGLAWEHLDFENCKVHICQQLQKDKAKGGQFYIQEGTKNGQSRILDVPDFLLEILQEEKQRQLRARLALSLIHI